MMGFKLIRLDSEEPTKIHLKVGTHIIGRGSFLNCDDHRVSRQHGVIKVTESTVLLKSLHQNPCFYNKREQKKTALLPQGQSITLSNTDHFGLLPDTYWYEIIFCDDNNQSNNPPQMDQENRLDTEIPVDIQNGNKDLNEETRVLTGYDNSGTQEVRYQEECDEGSDSELLNLEFDKTMEDEKGDESQSLIHDNPIPDDSTTTPQDLDTSPSNDQSKDDETHNETTPGKRSHSPDPSHQSKKAKTELTSPETSKNLGETEEFKSAESYSISEIARPNSPINEDSQNTTNINTVQNAMDVDTNSTDMNEQAKDSNTDVESNDVDTDSSRPSNEVKNDVDTVPSNVVKNEPKSPSTDVKTEPLTPKEENKDPDVAKPGPSHDQAGSSNDGAAPKPPYQPVRERCIYGASCYSPADDGSRRRRVTYSQLEVLWEFLRSNKEIAVACNKTAQARELCKRMWQTASEELNAQSDGSVKDWKGWSSYWVDYKAKLKKKVTTVKASQNRSGGSSDALSLSDVEEKFASILGDGFITGSPAIVDPSSALTTLASGSVKLETPDSSAEEINPDTSQHRNIPAPRIIPPRHSTCRPVRRPRARHMTEEAARRSLVEFAKASLDESRRNGIALENILYQVTRIADKIDRFVGGPNEK